MQGGGQGARGEVTVCHLLVFIRDKAIPLHKAERLTAKQEQKCCPGRMSTSIVLSRCFRVLLHKVIDWFILTTVKYGLRALSFLSLFIKKKLSQVLGGSRARGSGSGCVCLMRGCGSKVRC